MASSRVMVLASFVVYYGFAPSAHRTLPGSGIYRFGFFRCTKVNRIGDVPGCKGAVRLSRCGAIRGFAGEDGTITTITPGQSPAYQSQSD